MEYTFIGEEGIGEGVTMAFYDSIAEEFKNWGITIELKDKIPDKLEFKMWQKS